MKPTSKPVRWRINAGGVEWFWKGQWVSVVGVQMTLNLFNAIDKVTSTYPERHYETK